MLTSCESGKSFILQNTAPSICSAHMKAKQRREQPDVSITTRKPPLPDPATVIVICVSTTLPSVASPLTS